MHTFRNYLPHIIILLIFTLVFALDIGAGGVSAMEHDNRHKGPYQQWSTPWVDSVMQGLTLDQRIAQLLMIRVHTDRDEAYYRERIALVERYNLGGVAFFKGSPTTQLRITNRLQAAAQIPLLIAMDAEWGPSMRLDSTIVFPRQMTLGAITGEHLIYEMGREVGRQLKRLGVHLNFAPVVDVNNNAANPVINFRSFGESRYNVARKGLAYMKGMQDEGILACAKHFPGHGDTDADSHYTLPVLQHSFEEIDSVHLFPFKALISEGLHSVMTAHLHIPSLEPTRNLAATLSEPIVTGLLQNTLGFNGLVITDALDMRGVSDFFKSGELELAALKAGNDILLLPEDVPAAINAIRKAAESGQIPISMIDNKVRKILYHKQLVGLDRFRPLEARNLIADLNTENAIRLNRRLAQEAITLVRNHNDILPLKNVNRRNTAALAIGAGSGNAFHRMLQRYHNLPMFVLDKNHQPAQATAILNQLQAYDRIIVSVHNTSMFQTRQYGITQETIALIKTLSKEKKVVLCLFANPYSLAYFGEDVLKLEAIVVAYQEGLNYEEATAQVVFGGMQARGRLPVSVSPYFPVYRGIPTPAGFRIGFSDPEDVGINSRDLDRIDSIVERGIRDGAFPGCQIVLARHGQIFYSKSFGYHTYEQTHPVQDTDIYDLASISKIAATTPAIMRLYEQQKIGLNENIGGYVPWTLGSDKESLRIKDIMGHQARLQAWIPFYTETLTDNGLNPFVYSEVPSEQFPLTVATNLYIHRDYTDTIHNRIRLSELRRNRNYLYSDLGFIMLADAVENVSGSRIDRFTDSVFYKPMGLSYMGFNPLERFEPEQIVPTELDTLFRKQLIHGHVHDPAAAMLGGVSGHAGLFSNAMDLAAFFQMLLQEGTYAGKQYLKPETVREFTAAHFQGNNNRRGLGFDKPSIRPGEAGPSAQRASVSSYGHSGFTGTYAWVDPREDLVYVFLSNRVHPDASNRKIIETNLRTSIHQLVYEALDRGRKEFTLYFQ